MFNVSNEHTFHIKVEGGMTGTVYEGTFTVKCLLTNAEAVRLAQKIDQYNGGAKDLPQGIYLLNRSFAELEVRGISFPSWWKDSTGGRDLLDSNVVFEVFNKSLDAEGVYRERMREAKVSADKALEASTSKKKASKES